MQTHRNISCSIPIAILLVVASFQLIVQVAYADDGRVQVGVYMESLCPDSRRFFLNQLVPTYRLIGEIMSPDIIPFGHARTIGNNKMVCQHGERECKGNRQMACVQSRAKSMKEQIETIGCMFKNQDSLEVCLKNNMPNVTVADIDNCTSSSESYNMMIEAEKKTGRVGYVPHLTLGSQHNSDLQQDIEFDLKNTICKHYNGTKPASCN